MKVITFRMKRWSCVLGDRRVRVAIGVLSDLSGRREDFFLYF